MKNLYKNELLGTVALQSALENSEHYRLSFAKTMLVLPLVFDKSLLSVLKNKNSIVLSSKDLLISNPSAFFAFRVRHEDLLIKSLNTIILAQELGIASIEGENLKLNRRFFFLNQKDIGNFALAILKAGPKLGIILREEASCLYQNFRIEL